MPICGTVSQISPPLRIVLVAVIGLIAAWMLFLRPKTEPAPAPTPAPATAPGVTGLSKAVDKAKDASATSDKANEKVQKATGDDDAAKADAGKSGSAKETAPQFVTGRELPLEPLTAEQTKGLPKRGRQGARQAPGLRGRRVRHQGEALGPHGPRRPRRAPRARQDQPLRAARSSRPRSTLGKLSSLNAVIGDLGVDADPVGRGRRPQPQGGRARPASSSATRSTRRSRTPAATAPRCASRTPTSAASTAPARTSTSAWTASTSRRRAPRSSRPRAASAA